MVVFHMKQLVTKMAEATISAYTGCPMCGTVLFEVWAVPTDGRGVFQNDMRLHGDTPQNTDRKTCATCAGPLSRVAGP